MSKINRIKLTAKQITGDDKNQFLAVPTSLIRSYPLSLIGLEELPTYHLFSWINRFNGITKVAILNLLVFLVLEIILLHID